MFITAIYADMGLFLLRFVVAVIFIYHALPKIMDTKAAAKGMDMPESGVLMLGFLEIAAAFGLLTGVLVQFSAVILGVLMIGSIAEKKLIRNIEFSSSKGTGWELDLLILAASIAIFLTGGGGIGLL